MEPVEIYGSRLKGVLLTLICVAFIAAGLVLIQRDGFRSQASGWAAIVFFGLALPFVVHRTLQASPRITIDDEGIFDSTAGTEKFRWSELTKAWLASIQRNRFICLELITEEQRLAALNPLRRTLAKANRSLGFTPFVINCSALAVPPERIFEMIQERRRLWHP